MCALLLSTLLFNMNQTEKTTLDLEQSLLAADKAFAQAVAAGHCCCCFGSFFFCCLSIVLQFFVSRHALFLLLVDVSEEEVRQDRVHFWLNSIRFLAGPDAPLVVAARR